MKPLAKKDLLNLQYFMLLTRGLEDRVKKLYRQGKIVGGVYTSTGQEAITIGAGYGLQEEDWVYPSHRDIGAHLIRGVPAWQCIAHYLARADGPSKGRDGNVHIGSVERRVVGFISHLGDGLPVVAGCAYAFKYLKKDNIAVVFFGEGASNRGDVHEAMNFAGVHKLPVIFICNNNQYAYSTPLSLTMSIENVADRAAAYGFPGVIADGNDVMDVHNKVAEADKRARSGEGPTLIECKTFRMSGHAEHDDASYVPKELFEEWAKRDPIPRHRKYMMSKKISDAEIKAVEEKVAKDLDEAVIKAESSPLPDPSTQREGVYAD